MSLAPDHPECHVNPDACMRLIRDLALDDIKRNDMIDNNEVDGNPCKRKYLVMINRVAFPVRHDPEKVEPLPMYGNRLPDIEIGARLRIARIVANMTQAEAAEKVGTDRASVAAAEEGRCHLNIHAIQEFAWAYECCCDAIIRRNAVHLDLVSRFREMPNYNEYLEATARKFNTYVAAEMEFEHYLGETREHIYTPELRVPTGGDDAIATAAEVAARDLRDRFGLASGPVEDMVKLFETELGIRVFPYPMNSSISCLYAHDERAGSCMMINAELPRTEFSAVAAQTLGHFMASRRKTLHLNQISRAASSGERFADFFSRCFLIPPDVVRRRFAEMVVGNSRPELSRIAKMASDFGVATQTLVLRLEELRLIPELAWKRMMDKDGMASTLSRLDSNYATPIVFQTPDIDVPLPPRLARMAKKVGRMNLYTEEQFRYLLDLDWNNAKRLMYKRFSEWTENDSKGEVYVWG